MSGQKKEIEHLVATLADRQNDAPKDQKQLTGPERAAVLMLAIGETHGAKSGRCSTMTTCASFPS